MTSIFNMIVAVHLARDKNMLILDHVIYTRSCNIENLPETDKHEQYKSTDISWKCVKLAYYSFVNCMIMNTDGSLGQHRTFWYYQNMIRCPLLMAQFLFILHMKLQFVFGLLKSDSCQIILYFSFLFCSTYAHVKCMRINTDGFSGQRISFW